MSVCQLVSHVCWCLVMSVLQVDTYIGTTTAWFCLVLIIVCELFITVHMSQLCHALNLKKCHLCRWWMVGWSVAESHSVCVL